MHVTVLLLAAFGCSPEHRGALPTSLRIDTLAVPGAEVHWYEVVGRTRTEILESLLHHSRKRGSAPTSRRRPAGGAPEPRRDDDATAARFSPPPSEGRASSCPPGSVPPTASQADEQQWMTYLRALAAHESGHVVRINAAADALGAEVTGPTCDDANAAGYQALDALQAANIDYDQATQYGATQGVDFWSGAALDLDSALLRHVATTVE